MQFQQHLHIGSTLRASSSCLIDPIQSYSFIFYPSLNAYNEDPRSLFIENFRRYSTQLLVLNHKSYFTNGFPFQLSPLSWCLACDLSFLEGFSWPHGFGFRFPSKEGFLMRFNSICCAQLESQNMLSCIFNFHRSALVLWLSCLLL